MPSYGYHCSRCGNFDSINTIANRNKTECPKCGRVCERDIEYELSCSDIQAVTDHPRWSVSMGVPVSQVEEFRKRFPDSIYDNRGRLLIKNRKHKLQEADRRDFVELS
jgi:putative FmdB family regulatory protein